MLPGCVVRGKKNPLHFGLPKRLREARRRAGITSKRLAALAEIAHDTVYLVERDERVPGIDIVEKLALALAVTPGWLAFGEDGPLRSNIAASAPSVAQRLHLARTRLGMSRKALGRESQTSDTAVRQTEELRTMPSVATIERFAKALGVSPGWLAFGVSIECSAAAKNDIVTDR